jgi:uncharacterized DUF497 family protein
MNGQPAFEWDELKDLENQEKHGVSFREARRAFEDPHRIIVKDRAHSRREQRYFCLGRVERGVLTVRFTYRGKRIRIFGAGFWREGKNRYEDEQRKRRR